MSSRPTWRDLSQGCMMIGEWKREGDGSVNKSPSPALSPLYKGLPDEKGRKGGTFSIHRIIGFIKNSHWPHPTLAFASSKRFSLIKYSRPVRLMITISPTASDCQSEASELQVRLDGLTTIIKVTLSPIQVVAIIFCVIGMIIVFNFYLNIEVTHP